MGQKLLAFRAATKEVHRFLGLAPTTPLRKHVADLEASTLVCFEASAKTNKVRRFKEFFDGAASWSRVEHIIARVEVGALAAERTSGARATANQFRLFLHAGA